MRTSEFLSELEKGLKKLSNEQRENALSFYAEIINGKIESGKNEEKAVADLGDVSTHIKEILSLYDIEINEKINISSSISEMSEAGTTCISFKSINQKTEGLEFEDINFLGLDMKSKRIELIKSDEENLRIINQKTNFFTKIHVYKKDNELYLKEKASKNFVIQIIIEILLLFAAVILFILFKKPIERLIIALVYVALNIITSIPQWFYYGKKNAIKVFVPDRVKTLHGRISSGKCILTKLSFDDINISLKSGSVHFNDVNAKSLISIVSSGSIKINQETLSMSKFENITVNISSGLMKANNMITNAFFTSCNSGSIKVSNAEIETIKGLIKSGTIKFENCRDVEKTTITCSSGSIKLIDFDSIQSYLKATSGTIKCENLKGSNKDYAINALVSSGSVRINNQKPNFRDDSLASRNIKALVSSGTIKLNFADDIVKI